MSATVELRSIGPEIPPSFEKIEERGRNIRITAMALGFLALFVLAISCICFGIAGLDPGAIMGLGAFAYLGGSVLSMTALGIAVGSIICGVVAAIYNRSSMQAI